MEKLYLEQSVSGDGKAKSGVLYALCWVLIALLVLLALICAANVLDPDPNVLRVNWMCVLGLAACLGLAAFIFLRKDYLRMEYDYILREDVLEVYGILNRRRRRRLAEIHLERVERCGPFANGAASAKARKWYLQTDNGLFHICYKEGSVLQEALLELNDEIAAQIRKSRRLRPGAWRNAEGKTIDYAGLS